MGTVVIEVEGELEFLTQGDGVFKNDYHPAINIGRDWWSLDTIIAKRLGMPAIPHGPAGPCKLRLEIERS